SPKAAIQQWQKYCADYDYEIRIRKERNREFPQPKQWPATLSDFYRAVISGKDEATNQKRFKDWLRDSVRKNLTFRHPGLGLPAPTEEQIEEETTKNFLGAKGGPIAKWLWREWAIGYLDWWKKEKRQRKVIAGRTRAAAAYARKIKKKRKP